MDTTKSNIKEASRITENWEKSKQLKHKFYQVTDANPKNETGKEGKLLKREEKDWRPG